MTVTAAVRGFSSCANASLAGETGKENTQTDRDARGALHNGTIQLMLLAPNGHRYTRMQV